MLHINKGNKRKNKFKFTELAEIAKDTTIITVRKISSKRLSLISSKLSLFNAVIIL